MSLVLGCKPVCSEHAVPAGVFLKLLPAVRAERGMFQLNSCYHCARVNVSL